MTVMTDLVLSLKAKKPQAQHIVNDAITTKTQPKKTIAMPIAKFLWNQTIKIMLEVNTLKCKMQLLLIGLQVGCNALTSVQSKNYRRSRSKGEGLQRV